MQVVYSIISLFESVVFSFPQPALSSHRHFLSLQEFLTCVHSNFCSCVCENSFVHLLSVDQSPGFQQLNLRPKQIGHNTYINPTTFKSLGHWENHLIDQASDAPSTIFFIISCKILCKKPFNLFFLFSYNFTKNKEF